MKNYEKLIDPIVGDNPCGVDIRTDTEANADYVKLKDLRTNLRREERKSIEMDQNVGIDKGEWDQVIDIATHILSKYSKDIEVISWLLEGLVRVEEIEGLEIGLDVLTKLLKTYGLKLYPQIEEGGDEDLEYKLRPISMLGGKYEAGTLIAPMYFAIIVNTNGGEKYSAWQFKEILKENKKESGYKVTQELLLGCDKLNNVISSINKEEINKMKLSLTSCVSKFNELNTLLSNIFGSNAPNLTNLDDVLNYCFNLVKNLSAIIEGKEVKVEVEEDGSNTNEEEKRKNNSVSFDNLEKIELDRVKAVKLLNMLAKYFRETEPHSPISYTIERVINWSGLSLPEMLCDLIPDKVRDAYCRYTGIPFIESNKEEQTDEEEA